MPVIQAIAGSARVLPYNSAMLDQPEFATQHSAFGIS